MRTLRYSKKSDRQQFGLYLKLVILGVAVVGGIAFVIHLIASVLLAPLAALIGIL
jgi:preprotein translocase subunit Sss1